VPRAKRRPSPTRRMSFWSAQADHRPEAFSGRIHSACQADRWPKALRGRIHPACPAPSVGLRRREECLSGRRRPAVGRRPSCRLKSAFSGACAPSVGLRRREECLFRSAQADRWPEAFSGRIHSACQADRWPKALRGRIHPACPAPSVGLRRRKECLSGRRRPTVGRRPFEAGFIRRAPRQASAFADAKNVFPVGAGRPVAGGLLGPNSFGLPGRPLAGGLSRPDSSGVPRAKRRPSPTRRMSFRSAQADRWPEAFSGRIHSACQADRRPKAL
jgi:hypothetical protein